MWMAALKSLRESSLDLKCSPSDCCVYLPLVILCFLFQECVFNQMQFCPQQTLTLLCFHFYSEWGKTFSSGTEGMWWCKSCPSVFPSRSNIPRRYRVRRRHLGTNNGQWSVPLFQKYLLLFQINAEFKKSWFPGAGVHSECCVRRLWLRFCLCLCIYNIYRVQKFVRFLDRSANVM